MILGIKYPPLTPEQAENHRLQRKIWRLESDKTAWKVLAIFLLLIIFIVAVMVMGLSV